MTRVPLSDTQRRMLAQIARINGLRATEAALGQLAAEILATPLIERHDLVTSVARARRAAEQSRD